MQTRTMKVGKDQSQKWVQSWHQGYLAEALSRKKVLWKLELGWETPRPWDDTQQAMGKSGQICARTPKIDPNKGGWKDNLG